MFHAARQMSCKQTQRKKLNWKNPRQMLFIWRIQEAKRNQNIWRKHEFFCLNSVKLWAANNNYVRHLAWNAFIMIWFHRMISPKWWNQWKRIHHRKLLIIIFRLINVHCRSPSSNWNNKSETTQNTKLWTYHFWTSSRKKISITIILCTPLTKLIVVFRIFYSVITSHPAGCTHHSIHVVAKQKCISVNEAIGVNESIETYVNRWIMYYEMMKPTIFPLAKWRLFVLHSVCVN